MKLPSFLVAVVTLLFFSPVNAMEYRNSYSGGNCSTCSWIAADGEIKDGDAKKLLDYIAANDIDYQNLIIINSPGGNVAAALELGQLVRKRGMRVMVGRTEDEEVEGALKTIQTYNPGICASACVFVLMGGVEREISEDSRVGVHQFAPTSDELGSVASATSSTQTIMAGLQGYAMQMGVDASVLTLASSTAPEDMMWLEPRDMERLNLLTSRNFRTMGEWELKPAGTGLIARTSQEQSNGRTTTFVVDCRNLYIGFQVTSERIKDIAESIRGVSLRTEASLSSYPLKIADVKLMEQMIVVSVAGGPAALNAIAKSGDKLMIDVDLPRAYEEEFGGGWHIIPSSNMAEIAPHVLGSCR